MAFPQAHAFRLSDDSTRLDLFADCQVTSHIEVAGPVRLHGLTPLNPQPLPLPAKVVWHIEQWCLLTWAVVYHFWGHQNLIKTNHP